MARPVIIVDTREQKPFTFSGYRVRTRRAALKHGDYTAAGLEEEAAVERKSLPDLFHSFTKTRRRMMQRLDDLAELEVAALVVEAPASQVLAGHALTSVSGDRLLGTLLFECASRGVLLFFCDDRAEAELVTYRLLVESEARLGDGMAARRRRLASR